MNNSEQQRKNLLEEKVSKVVVQMAIPSIVMQLIMLIYNTADTYFIAQIDKSAAAAVGTVFSIQAVIQAIGFGFGMGISSLCSRKLGEAADEEAEKYAASGVFGAAVLAGILSIAAICILRPLLFLIGCTETMLTYARAYSLVILFFAPLSCSVFAINNIFKAEGHMQFSMCGNVIGALVNVVLDPIFIFSLHLGTLGAALATALSQLLSLIIFCSYFRRGKTVMKLKISRISKSIDTYIQIITTGMPTFFRQGLASLATALLCKQGAVYGDEAVAAVTISNKCYMLLRNVVLGIGQGTQPVAGYNYGAHRYKRAKEAYAFAMQVGTAICLVSSGAMFLFARQIMWWFCKDESVLAYGVPALHYASMVVPVMAVSTYVNQAYQCYGYKRQATFLASCRQGICFIPVILILPRIIGAAGVEMAQPLADLLTFLISVPFYIRMVKHLNKLQKETDVPGEQSFVCFP